MGTNSRKMGTTEIEELKSHSQMLGQIASWVEDFCISEETTTLEAVKEVLEQLQEERKFANELLRAINKAQIEHDIEIKIPTIP